jgi:LacI family transcriptional regulator
MIQRTASEAHTIHDIARAAGVSIATVSRVINGSAGVRAEKVQRVREVIARFNYQPNPFARSLLAGSSGAVGVLVPGLDDEFYGSIVTGLEGRLREHGLQVTVALGHDDAEDEARAVAGFRSRQVDGLIVLAHRLSDAALIALHDDSLPTVLVNRFIPELGAHCLRLDNRHGGLAATRHLVALGHGRIAHISGPLERAGARERLDGYRAALREAALPIEDALCVESDFSEAGGERAVARLLGRTAFSAVFAASDRIAVGALAGLRAAGVAVPTAVSVVGFDDRLIGRYSAPSLTTMHYPMHEMGARAADHLVARLRGETPPALPVLEPQLVVRASSAAPSDAHERTKSLS